MNLQYPRLGKQNSPRLRLEWLPSGIIPDQSLDLSSYHFNLHSFITPTSDRYSLSLVTLYSHIHQLVSEPRLPFGQVCSPNTLPKQKNTQNNQTGKNCASTKRPAEIWHGVPVRLGTTVPLPSRLKQPSIKRTHITMSANSSKSSKGAQERVEELEAQVKYLQL